MQFGLPHSRSNVLWLKPLEVCAHCRRRRIAPTQCALSASLHPSGNKGVCPRHRTGQPHSADANIPIIAPANAPTRALVNPSSRTASREPNPPAKPDAKPIAAPVIVPLIAPAPTAPTNITTARPLTLLPPRRSSRRTLPSRQPLRRPRRRQ